VGLFYPYTCTLVRLLGPCYKTGQFCPDIPMDFGRTDTAKALASTSTKASVLALAASSRRHRPYCISSHCPLGFSSGAQSTLRQNIPTAHRWCLPNALLPQAPPPLVVGPKVHRSAGLRALQGLPKGSSLQHHLPWSQLIRGHANRQNRFLLSDFKHFSPSFQGSFHFSLTVLVRYRYPTSI